MDVYVDKNFERWFEAICAVVHDKVPICPICGKSSHICIYKHEFENHIGFMIITCKKCKKSGYSSRMIFIP